MRALRTWAPWLMSAIFAAGVAYSSDPEISRSDLFRRYFTASGANLTLANDGDLTVERIVFDSSTTSITGAITSAQDNNFIYFTGAQLRSTLGFYTDATYSSIIASGSNAFAVITNGARIDFGAGASDYASSDGTTVTFAGPLTATGALTATGSSGDISLGGGDLASTLATQTFNITSATNDATTSTTVAAITIAPTVDLTAGDLVLEVNNSAGASLFTIDEQGNVVLDGTSIVGSFTTATFTIYSSTNAATVSSTVAPITLQPIIAAEAGSDLLVEVNNSVGTAMFAINANPGVVINGAAGTAGQVLRSGGASAATAWGSGLGARTDVQNLTIGAAGATFGCAVATATVTCSVGQHVEITPQQDDAAWDTGQLMAFCESTDVVKVSFCGGSSADPANTNDYFIDVTTP